MSADASPTPLLNDIPPPPNSFVLPDHKMVYMSVTKAACTSLRWMVADLAGEDPESFIGAMGGQQSRLLGIHGQRSRWRRTPQLSTLDSEQLAEISPDNGWFVFAAVRDPRSRLWSAWQSKFLVRHVRYVERYADRPWFPRVPESPEQVLEDWRAFVHARPWESDPDLRTDVHFQSQVRSVRPDGVNYTRIYDLRELSTLFADVHEHLRPLGLDQPLYTPRANETPLPMVPEALEDGIAEIIEDSFADDFRAFGDRWSIDRLRMSDGWSADAIEHAAYHTVANERIGDLRTEGRRLQQELKQAQRELERTQRQLERAQRAPRPQGTATSAPGPSTRALGRVLDSGPAHRLARSSWVRRVVPDRVQAAARSTVRRST
ncbi:sulfotransferase family 2 domain-containing protein [Janibacter cremeus]|uniref:sulfotransferase family 2 domain-containing protein n=1 Tax=Janibacter cremeus TaxID=1285192 RepID=UPI0023FA466C|nr:sulfotransferase family 2 domain-containing protein [Janibacter cremeus]WEV79369.1 sulfotransferase family 2 domain-containing protein [Janibacter cremeus]